MKHPILFLLALAALLPGCGKKGPLVLSPEILPPAAEGLELRQVGNQVELSWRYPALLADGETPLQPAQVRGAAVYHLDKPFVAETFEKKSRLLARPKAADLSSDGQRVSFAVAFKAKDLRGREHAFAVAYHYGRSRSPLSAVQKIATRIAPEAVRGLTLARQGKVVVLRWSRPLVDSEGQPLSDLLGYRVSRRILEPGREPGPFAPLTDKPVRGEYYEDADTGRDGDYEYRVAALLDRRIESAPSAAAGTRVEDTFPPDIPGNLVAFTASDHVFLTWEAVRDRDFDHYIVLRKGERDEDFVVLADAVAENFYRDRQVAKGREYAYAVAAVDRKGNRSETGRPARHKFE